MIEYVEDLVEVLRKKLDSANAEIRALKADNTRLDAIYGKLALRTNQNRHRAYEIRRTLDEGLMDHRGAAVKYNNIRIALEAIEQL